MSVDTETWPLSAAATRALRAPKSGTNELLKLALKELVLRRAYTIERVEEPRRSGRPKVTVLLRPGSAPVPELPPLPLLDRHLREAWDDGKEAMPLRKLVQRLPNHIGMRVRDAVREELRARGLVELERRKALGVIPRTVVTVTPSGESWQAASYEREERLAEAVGGEGQGAPGVPLGAQAAALGGMLLLLSPAPLAELDGALRRVGEDGAATAAVAGPEGGGEGFDLDLSFLDGIGDLVGTTFDGAFDSAVDAGSADGGGGDGGGGGGE